MGGGKHPFASLRDVARERRAEDSDDGQWEARRRGQLSEGEEQALASQAASDEYAAHMRALSEPLDAGAQEALLARVTDLISQAQPARTDAPGQTTAAVAAAPTATVSDLSARRRKLRATGALGVVLAAAAALLVLVRAPGGELALPPYEGELTGTDRAERAGASVQPSEPRKHISPGAQVRLRARPLEPLAEQTQLAGRLFLVQGAHAEPVAVPVSVGARGAAQVSAPYEALFGARTGAWDLVLFVGTAQALPASADAALAQLARGDSQVQSVRFALELGH
jgi:hypothetical protein